MPIPNTVTALHCQNCGTSYLRTDRNGAYYFRSDSAFAIGAYASPFQINAAGENITFCPACDTGPLGDAYKEPVTGIKESPLHVGDSRVIGETEAEVDARHAELDQASHDADIEHTP
jgi:hypothetical protein